MQLQSADSKPSPHGAAASAIDEAAQAPAEVTVTAAAPATCLEPAEEAGKPPPPQAAPKNGVRARRLTSDALQPVAAGEVQAPGGKRSRVDDTAGKQQVQEEQPQAQRKRGRAAQ
ncbi:hypothetical protein ABPG75_005937 [Micractinium tetrahymenae]